MKVIVSTAVSADGYLDDRSPDRLILSTPEDWAEVHRLRAACDAILVGAETIRRDNPSLLVGDEVLRRERIDRGLPSNPVKVTLTASCRLSPEANFFTRGDQEKIVFTTCPDPGPLRQVATVIPAAEITAALIVTELEKRGLRLPAGRRRSCDAPDVLRRKSGRYLPAGCQSGRKSGGSPGTPFGDRFRLSANAAFDRIVGRNAGHDLCDQARPDRRRPSLPANGDRRKPQMYPIDLFLLCRCSNCND